ncbi:hypothetical protein HFP15_32835 [Amycolatopsis sp. K13G38]|uniref:AAA family ATPase n=1 Tax=Amycolatopsis acididurans TaxID=2724524 RepID=A0ABX1JCY7_9PSEU|nr:hypothetical protein [Amycolatopsis acididurans]NKQ57658.1 hypothetical protein [Amycolatopsis acididurans]
MSTLGEAVHDGCVQTGFDIELEEVERILADAGVSTSATTGVPVRLRVRKLHVTGTKVLEVDDADLEVGAKPAVAVPFDLGWTPADGVNGVGSERNFRGKSSVLRFLEWALTGRCPLQPDVRAWLDHVEVEFGIDAVSVIVSFAVAAGAPSGTVVQLTTTGVTQRRIPLGAFDGDVEFESLMGALMLERLRLEPIAMWTKDQEISHAWPTYASALAVYADVLDPVVGNQGVLGTRMLQMFIGTRWAPARAQAQTALNAVKYARDQAASKAKIANELAQTPLAAAESRVAAARERFASFDTAEPDVDAVLAAAAKAADAARLAQEISLRLTAARSAAVQVNDQVRVERARRNTAVEDALARRFFNAMTPTVCPRCSSAVTEQRRQAEGHDHTCSVCSAHLDLDAFAGNVVVASDIADHAREELLAATAHVEKGVDDEEPDTDILDALLRAASEANAAVAAIEAEFAEAEQVRRDAEATALAAQAGAERARERFQVELELARAEGALESMRQRARASSPERSDAARVAVLEAADRVTGTWLKRDQDPLLVNVSKEITRLVRSFGADNITSVSLKGNANMDVHKGGTKSGYSALTNGEKLRLKLATAIALIAHGHRAGVGRHPGLLFIDSPAAEEIPADDLQIILEAMRTAAEETSMQIVVATTHSSLLTALLPPGNALVAMGDDFVW